MMSEPEDTPMLDLEKEEEEVRIQIASENVD